MSGVAEVDATVGETSSLRPLRSRTLVQRENSSNVDILSNGRVHAADASKVMDGKHLNHPVLGDTSLDKKETPARKALPASAVIPRRRRIVMKPDRPRWQRCISVTLKFSILILGVVGLLRLILWGGIPNMTPLGSPEYEHQLADLEGSLKVATKMMQIQIEAIDRKMDEAIDKKMEDRVVLIRKELIEKLEEQGVMLGGKIKTLDEKSNFLERKLNDMDFLSKEDVSFFLSELMNKTTFAKGDQEPNWDKIRTVAKEIVMKEMNKFAADGLGKVDYALASGGARVIRHSEPYNAARVSNWFPSKGSTKVNSRAQKMLEPSFGEPGQCFALKGSSAFVEIKLRTAIIPEAVTLEHVAKSVAYDRTSAPKEFRISGWLDSPLEEASSEPDKFILGEFIYDLERNYAQTFDLKQLVEKNCIVDTIRIDIMSNHGNTLHTCIYRLRVHGSESDSIVPITDISQVEL